MTAEEQGATMMTKEVCWQQHWAKDFYILVLFSVAITLHIFLLFVCLLFIVHSLFVNLSFVNLSCVHLSFVHRSFLFVVHCLFVHRSFIVCSFVICLSFVHQSFIILFPNVVASKLLSSSLLPPVPLQSCLPLVTVVIITANVLTPLLHAV